MFANILNYMGRPPTTAAATPPVQDIRAQIDVLEKRREFVEKKIEDQGNIAKQALAKKNQASARLAMKRRLDLQKQLDTIVNSIMKLDSMVNSMETNALSKSVAKSMENGTRVMKEHQASISVKKVDDIMLDAEETLAETQRLNEAVSQPLNNGGASNEELDEELAQFMAENDAGEQATVKPSAEQRPTESTTPVSALKYPAAPNEKPKEDDGIEKELAKLAAEMAI